MPAILLAILKTFLTRKIIEKIIIGLLEYAARSSENKIDDEVIKIVKSAIKG
jgi:hypothetical protein